MARAGQHKVDPAVKAEAIERVRAGERMRDVAAALGVSWLSVKCWCDPKYYKQRRELIKLQARAWRGGDTAADHVRHRANIDDDILRTVPRDTRGLTARLLGDPLPGRSALDRSGGAP